MFEGSGASPRVGFVGAGSIRWAYLQVRDRIVPRGLAEEGPIGARAMTRAEAEPAFALDGGGPMRLEAGGIYRDLGEETL